jgi:hypothetical protein
MGKQFVFDTCAFIHLEPYIIRLVLLSGAASKGKSLKYQKDDHWTERRLKIQMNQDTEHKTSGKKFSDI